MNPTLQFAAFVGLDWDDQKNVICLLPAAGGVTEPDEVKQRPEAIADWAAGLRERFGGCPVAVCLEQSRGPLIYALMQYEFLVLYPINPKQLSDYREALYPSGAKSDPNDAELLAQFLRDHRDKLRAWRPDDAISRGLRMFSEQRRKWVDDRVALTNELRQRLKESYLLALDLHGTHLTSEAALAFLERFPTQAELQRASPKQLAKWLPQPRRVVEDPPVEELLKARIAAIRNALPLTTDAAVLEHARLVVPTLVKMIQMLNRTIADCDAKIAELFARHADASLFASFPGAGKALAPRLAAAYGTDRQKYLKAEDMQQLSGIAPVTKASGKTQVVHMRWACPTFLRQTFHEFARCSVKFSPWAAAYFQMRTARGDRYHEIIRGLAFKWQRILFHCWKTRQPYSEEQHQKTLRYSESPLLAYLTPQEATA